MFIFLRIHLTSSRARDVRPTRFVYFGNFLCGTPLVSGLLWHRSRSSSFCSVRSLVGFLRTREFRLHFLVAMAMAVVYGQRSGSVALLVESDRRPFFAGFRRHFHSSCPTAPLCVQPPVSEAVEPTFWTVIVWRLHCSPCESRISEYRAESADIFAFFLSPLRIVRGAKPILIVPRDLPSVNMYYEEPFILFFEATKVFFWCLSMRF